MRENASNQIRDHDSTGALRLLLTGEKTPGGGCELLRRIGFLHLLTASGIHLYALARWIDFISRHLLNALRVPIGCGIHLSRFFSSTVWLLSWLLCGARMGMLRPWFLILLQSSSRFLGFKWRKWTPLALALFLDSLIGWLRADEAPNGRLVYFLAVAGATLTRENSLRSHLKMAFSSWIFVALFEAHRDHLVSIAAPVINLISATVLAGFIYPLLILSTILDQVGLDLLATPLAGAVSCFGSQFIESIALTCVRFNGLSNLSSLSIWGGALASSLVLLAKRTNVTFAATLIVLGLVRVSGGVLTKTPTQWPTHADRLFQLDVGQGDAALVYWGNPPQRFAGLIDTGSSEALSPVEWIKIFARTDVSRLNWIFLTHLDQDHSGGIRNILPVSNPRCVMTSNFEWNTPRGQNLAELVRSFEAKTTGVPADCIPFPVLLPNSPQKKAPSRNANMSAILIPLEKDGVYLSAGDAAKNEELRIGKWANEMTSVQARFRILKISHHGSKSSTSSEFLTQVRPTAVWISSGVGNNYGHPHEETMALLRRTGISVKRTDFTGLISSESVPIKEAGDHHPR